MALADLLIGSGPLTKARDKHEHKRLMRFARTLYVSLGKRGNGTFQISENDAVILMRSIEMCRRLCIADVRTTEDLPYKSVSVGLAKSVMSVVNTRGKIRFVSFASAAIDPHRQRVVEKKQYDYPNRVLSTIASTMDGLGLRWQYDVILADADSRIQSENAESLWEENQRYLQGKCATKVSRLTQVVGSQSLQDTVRSMSETKRGLLEAEATDYWFKPSFQASFKSSLERVLFQMQLYSTIGVWLEQNMPNCVVMDIQKQMYPYEQPYFNRFRTTPLALFRVASKERK